MNRAQYERDKGRKAACSEGFQFCQKQDSVLSCNTFAYHCTGACPWEITVTDSTSGGHSVSTEETNSFTQCRRSCHRGQRDCNVKRKQIPFRQRSADFNACVEVQFGCYDTCSTWLDHEIDQCAEACDQGAAACNADPNPSKCGVYNNIVRCIWNTTMSVMNRKGFPIVRMPVKPAGGFARKFLSEKIHRCRHVKLSTPD